MIELSETELRQCCAASRWVAGMLAAQPFADADAALAAADAVWRELGPDDWLEAFAAHPRIGDRTASGASAREQAGVRGADADTLAALAEGNRAYERRFGFVFLICATGKTAGEMLAALRARIDNDRATELRIAAAEQLQITRLRLARALKEASR